MLSFSNKPLPLPVPTSRATVSTVESLVTGPRTVLGRRTCCPLLPSLLPRSHSRRRDPSHLRKGHRVKETTPRMLGRRLLPKTMNLRGRLLMDVLGCGVQNALAGQQVMVPIRIVVHPIAQVLLLLRPTLSLKTHQLGVFNSTWTPAFKVLPWTSSPLLFLYSGHSLSLFLE